MKISLRRIATSLLFIILCLFGLLPAAMVVFGPENTFNLSVFWLAWAATISVEALCVLAFKRLVTRLPVGRLLTGFALAFITIVIFSFTLGVLETTSYSCGLRTGLLDVCATTSTDITSMFIVSPAVLIATIASTVLILFITSRQHTSTQMQQLGRIGEKAALIGSLALTCTGIVALLTIFIPTYLVLDSYEKNQLFVTVSVSLFVLLFCLLVVYRLVKKYPIRHLTLAVLGVFAILTLSMTSYLAANLLPKACDTTPGYASGLYTGVEDFHAIAPSSHCDEPHVDQLSRYILSDRFGSAVTILTAIGVVSLFIRRRGGPVPISPVLMRAARHPHPKPLVITALAITGFGALGASYVTVASIGGGMAMAPQRFAFISLCVYLFVLVYCIVIARRLDRNQPVPLLASYILIAFAILTIATFVLTPSIAYRFGQIFTPLTDLAMSGSLWNRYIYTQLGTHGYVITSTPFTIGIGVATAIGMSSIIRKK